VRLLVRLDRFELPLASAAGAVARLKGSALRKLDRYAVVGGPDWIEGVVPVAGALTPVEVRHFDADEEDEARAWIARPAGAPDEPDEEHLEPAARLVASSRPDLVAVAVDGRLTEADYQTVITPALEAALAHAPAIDLLVRFDDFEGVSLGAARRDALLARHARSLRRVALVDAPGWMETLAGTMGSLLPTSVRTFRREADARAWLDAS
jgi:hypothetical protein